MDSDSGCMRLEWEKLTRKEHKKPSDSQYICFFSFEHMHHYSLSKHFLASYKCEDIASEKLV
jgi:hypothetical protein